MRFFYRIEDAVEDFYESGEFQASTVEIAKAKVKRNAQKMKEAGAVLVSAQLYTLTWEYIYRNEDF